VDRALNGRPEISQRTRERILRIARENGYEPDLNARALATGCPIIRIGVCVPREIRAFYDQMRSGIQEEAERSRHARVEISHRPVDRLGAGEAAAVRELLDQGVNALIVTPGDPAELAPLIDEAERERNVRVICVATDDSLSSRSTTISVEPRLNGRLAAELLAKFVSPSSEVAVVTGMLTTEDHCQKVTGFCEVFPRDCPEGRIVAVIEGHEDEAETFAKCAALVRNRPALAGLYVSTVNCLPVCCALQAEHRAGKVRLVATDLFADAVPYFQDGTISASIYQKPYEQGKAAVGLLIDYFVRGSELPRAYYLAPSIVMRTNLGLFRESLDAAR
jgi:LacI family transcriptional regulator